MKAILLAAGLGTRLRPLTDRLPKCLVPVRGTPLLGLWLTLLEQHGVEEVLINTHYLAPQVDDYVAGWHGRTKIRIAHEPVLAGSAGTIKRNWDFLKSEERFFVCNADNLTDINLSQLLSFHDTVGALLTLALFETERPHECGIVGTDLSGAVTSFVEKPTAPCSRLANGGVYVMSREIESLLPTYEPADIAFDLMPQSLHRAYGWRWNGLLLDIGSPAAYESAQRAFCDLPHALAQHH